MAGGARYKMNLDLTEEEFASLSLEDMNEINLRIAKRLNESVKRWEKTDKDVANLIKMRYGEHPFTYKKATRKRDAINRHDKALNYIKKGFSSKKSYEAQKHKRDEQLAQNTDLTFLTDADKAELGNFFSVMYDKLKLDAELYNYRSVCNQFIDYKMTAHEHESMMEYIRESWNNFTMNNAKYANKTEYDQKIAQFREKYTQGWREYGNI